MSCTVETKNMYSVLEDLEYQELQLGATGTGTLQFDEEKRRCYIETNDGRRIPTTPMFSFFNGFISLHELCAVMSDYYSEEDIGWFAAQWNAFNDGDLSNKDLFDVCKERFQF